MAISQKVESSRNGESENQILSLGLSSPRPWGRREWGGSPALTGKGWEWESKTCYEGQPCSVTVSLYSNLHLKIQYVI